MNGENYIYEVYKEGSFSLAAKNLFISQPALSVAVKKTEKELGITIFDRSVSPIKLTAAGKVYIEAIEEKMRIEQKFKVQLADLNELRTGKIRVSGENFVSSFIMPKILLEFSARYPGITVELVESNSPDLRSQLLSEQIDLLIAHDFEDDLYCFEPLFKEKILLAVPESIKLDRKTEAKALTIDEIENADYEEKSVALSTFSDFPFLLLKNGNDMFRRANLLFEKEKIIPQTKIYLDQLITSYNMALAGMGIAFVTDKLITAAGKSGCRYFAIKGAAEGREMAIGYKKNRYISKAQTAFIECAKDVYK